MKTLVVKTNEVTFSNHACMSTEGCSSLSSQRMSMLLTEQFASEVQNCSIIG